MGLNAERHVHTVSIKSDLRKPRSWAFPAAQAFPAEFLVSEWTRPPLCPPALLCLRRPRLPRRLVYLFPSHTPPPHSPLYGKRNLLVLGKSGPEALAGAGAQATGGGAGWHCGPWPGLCPRDVRGSEPRPGLVTRHPNLSWGTGANIQQPRLGFVFGWQDADAGLSAPRGRKRLGWHLISS